MFLAPSYTIHSIFEFMIWCYVFCSVLGYVVSYPLSYVIRYFLRYFLRYYLCFVLCYYWLRLLLPASLCYSFLQPLRYFLRFSS